MPTVLVEERRRSGTIPPPPVLPERRGDDGSGGSQPPFPISRGQVALWAALTGIIMLFAGLSSAFIVLRGVPSWQNIAMPSLLWLNTAVLLASSVTFELSRGAVRANRLNAMKRWLTLESASSPIGPLSLSRMHPSYY